MNAIETIIKALQFVDAKLGVKALSSKSTTLQPETEELRPVMVTTEFRGVFFGYASDTSGDPIVLKNARNCIYWTADEKGFMGLGVTGPGPKCKIGPAVPAIELRKITSVTEVTGEAVKAWEAAPFAK